MATARARRLRVRGPRWAVEVRDRSWLHDDVFDVLHRHGAALCIHDLLPDHPRLLTTDWTYVRFHGPDATHRPYRGGYSGRALRSWAEWIDTTREQQHDVYAYFNNDVDAHAYADVARLRTVVDRIASAAR